MGHALRQSVDRQRASSRLTASGLRPHRHAAALPAIFGDHDGDRQRQVLPRADEDAQDADGAQRAALLRRARLHRGAGQSRSSKHLAGLDFQPETVVASYHGIPRAYFERGDPYHCHCLKTTRLLRERLGWDDKKLITTFQSRFGAQEWLQPYTDKTVERLARDGVRSIAVVNPGFSADCIETLEEIDMEVRETFHAAGGKNFFHIPCLNDSDEGMAVDRDDRAPRVVRLGVSNPGLRIREMIGDSRASRGALQIVTATIHA